MVRHDCTPCPGIRQRITLNGQPRASKVKAPLIGKMGIKRVSLNAGLLSHHAEGGERRPYTAVQVDGGFDNSSPCLRLLLGAALQSVGAGHFILVTRQCAFNVDTAIKFKYTHVYYET